MVKARKTAASTIAIPELLKEDSSISHLKKGFLFKIPSSPKGYAEKSMAGPSFPRVAR